MLMERIEQTAVSIVAQIAAGFLPKVQYNTACWNLNSGLVIGREAVVAETTTNDSESLEIEDVSSLPEDLLTISTCTVNYASSKSRRKFILMMATMERAHSLLLQNTTQTKRSFYYYLKSTRIMGSEFDVDSIYAAINCTAKMLECAPWDLGFISTSHRLVAGDLTIILHDDTKIQSQCSQATLIPSLRCNIKSLRTTADFVLVVEKDAIFQHLLMANCPESLNCILITGMGYPDVGTRMLIVELSEKLQLPVYVLVDANPFGVEIMCAYRFGTASLAQSSDLLACPAIRWLGLHPSEVQRLRMQTIPLSRLDCLKLTSLLARSYMNDSLRYELDIMKLGKQDLEAAPYFLQSRQTIHYIRQKIETRQYL